MKIVPRTAVVRVLYASLLILAQLPTKAQLVIFQEQTPDTLVQNVLLGPDVSVSNITFNGHAGDSIPEGEEGLRFGRFNSTNSNVGLDAGIILFSGSATLAIGPNDEEVVSSGGMPSSATPDLDLSRISGYDYWQVSGGNNIYNKSILEFDLVPVNDMISFRYVFSSEEYERWTCLDYNDAFGFFLSGPGIDGPFTNGAINLALVPGSLAPVSVNTVNSGTVANNANGGDPWAPFAGCYAADSSWAENTEYYIYNGSWVQGLQGGAQTEPPYCCDPYYIQHNGLTVVLTASAAVHIGETYHIKMGLGNAGDWRVPSAVYIEQGSFACGDRFTLTVDDAPNVNTTVTDPILYESDADSIHLRFNRWGGFYLDEHLQVVVEGNALPGVDYLPALPDSLHFNQLDSAVVFPIAVPVRSTEMREITIHLITSNGGKVMTYHLIIAPEIMLGVDGIQNVVREHLNVFPNPAQDMLYVTLPPGTEGRAEIQVLDMAGRVVMQYVFNSNTSAPLDVSQLTTGLYTVMAKAQGRITTARVNVQH